MLLFELFDSKIELDWKTKSKKQYTAQAVIGDRTIQYNANLLIMGWTISFSQVTKGETKDTHDFHMTGSGGSDQVMAGLKLFLEKFVAEVDPDKMNFSASKESKSRASVYEKFVKRMLQTSGLEYTISKSEGFDDKLVDFELVKKGYKEPQWEAE